MKDIMWPRVIKNSVVLICFTVLSIVFSKWWIILFSVIFLSPLEAQKDAENEAIQVKVRQEETK